MESESALIHDIYASALGTHSWQDVVERTAKELDASGAFLFTTFVAESDGGVAISHGLPLRETTRFLSEVATVDVWYHALLRRYGQLSTGFRWQSDELVPVRHLQRTRFFADYLVPCDIGRTLGAIIGDGKSEWLPLMPLCFYRPVRSKPFTPENEAKLKFLQPHFTRAMEMKHRLCLASQGQATVVLERLSTAVLLLARDRKVLLANSPAESILASTTPSLVREGKLYPSAPAQSAALDNALEACGRYGFDERFSLSFRLAGAAGAGVVARLAPLPVSGLKPLQAVAIAFLHREGQANVDLRVIMKSLYKLTAAEAELAKWLAEGGNQDDFAERRAVSLATVKTQLQSVFSKTGVRRQADLVRLMYSIAGG